MGKHSAVREGIVAGAIGATVVALWFLLVDLITGQPFYTPEVLGNGLLSLLGPAGGDSTFMVVLVYTLVHYALFAVIGIVAVAIVHAGEREPSVLAGGLILFVAIEIGFYGLTALLSESDALGALAWYQIGLANLLAALAMGYYLYRAHPALGRRLDFALSGGER